MLNQSIFGIIILLLTNAFVIAHGGYCFVILLDNIAVYFNVVVAEIIADNSISLLINLCFLCVLKLNPTQSNLSCRSITTSVICVRFKCHLQASHVNCPHKTSAQHLTGPTPSHRISLRMYNTIISKYLL